ncbi:MAG: ribosomal protein S18-alanine N-acetyltransferase [Pseudomonadota bacterium]
MLKSKLNKKIRLANIKFLEKIYEIEKLSFSDPWFLNIFKAIFQSEKEIVYILEIAGEVAGFIVLSFILDEAEIYNVAVHPSFRKRGLGQALVEHAIYLAKKKSCKVCFLEVRKSNKAALDLYIKQGFKLDTCRKAYYPDGEDALLMSRVL